MYTMSCIYHNNICYIPYTIGILLFLFSFGAPIVEDAEPISWIHFPKAGSSFINAIIHLPGVCPSMANASWPSWLYIKFIPHIYIYTYIYIIPYIYMCLCIYIYINKYATYHFWVLSLYEVFRRLLRGSLVGSSVLRVFRPKKCRSP